MQNSGNSTFNPFIQDQNDCEIRREWRRDETDRQLSDFNIIQNRTGMYLLIATSRFNAGTSAIVFFALTILFGACSSYKATADRQEQLSYDALRVQPAWEHHEQPAQKFILPAVGLTAGALYGYQTEFTYGGETFDGTENAALWGGVGLVGGVVLNNTLFPKRPRARRAFDLSESDKWLRSWNHATGSDYLIRENSTNNSLILVPRARVLEIRQEYRSLEEDLSQSRPSTSYAALQEWKQKLSGEYSILPATELSYVERLISEYESKVASAELESQLADIEAMESTYNTITTLHRLQRELGPVYYLAEPESQRMFDGHVRTRITAILAGVLPEDEHRVDRVSSSMEGIEELNGLFRDFDRRYGLLKDFDMVNGMYERFHRKKEEILITNSVQIDAQINGAVSVDQLEDLDARYFVALHSERGEVADVRNHLIQRREAILAEERRQQIEAQTAAQQRAQAALAAQNEALAAENSLLTPNSFLARGLANEALMIRIYRGEFVNIDLNRDGMRFVLLYSAYLNSYAKQCPAHLPADKIEMTRQVCSGWIETRDGWGNFVSRNCNSWETVNTGLYADPEMYKAKFELELLQAGDAFRQAFGVFSANDPIAETFNLVGDTATISSDMTRLLQLNACDSPGLMRFQGNLRLFALNKRPKRLAGEAVTYSVVNPLPGSLFEDQNYTRFIEDLVYDQSSSWVMNRYERGSISNVTVSSRDDLGRPTRINARYTYTGLSGRTNGSVTLTFDEGWPECLYFYDNQAVCRSPNRRIVDAYAKGAY